MDTEKIYKKAYDCKNNELTTLLKQIETLTQEDKSDYWLSRAKTIVTTRILTQKEK